MRFEFRHGLIWLAIQVEYDGKAVRIEDCILDTGSATTAVDIDCIEFNYQKPARIRRLFGVGSGVQEVVCQTVDCMTFGTEKILNPEIEFGRFESRFGIRGFVGTDVLSRFTTTLNFRTSEISFIPLR
jgi:hypothetical protein